MVELQSYKSMPKQDTFSWADLNFSTLYKIIDARANNYEQFKAFVTALDCALYFFSQKDNEYITELELMKIKKLELKQSCSPEAIELWEWDEKFKILSSLVARVNQGKIKLQEYATGNSKLVKDISGKLLQGIGQNLFITGKPGSGKSESGIKIGGEVSLLVNVKFPLSKNITFRPEDFAERYNDLEGVPEGSTLMFDDAGVNYNAQDWFTEPSKIFTKLMQIIRHRALFVIFTSPDLSFINAQSRKLLHWWLETDKLNMSQGICYIKPHVVEIIQQSGQIIYPYPIYDDKQLTMIKVTALDKESRNEYQTMAKKFKDDFGRLAELQLKLKTSDPITVQYVNLRNKGIKQQKIRTELIPMSTTKASRLENEFKRFIANGANKESFL